MREIKKRKLMITKNNGGARVVRLGLPVGIVDSLAADEVYLHQLTKGNLLVSKKKRTEEELTKIEKILEE